MPTPSVQPIAVSITNFSAMTNLGRTTAYNLIAQGKLQKIKVLGRTLITVESINALIESSIASTEAAK